METWKTIPDYEGLYEVSDQGRVRRICEFHRAPPPPYLLKPQRHNHGYLLVALHRGAVNGKRQQKMRLVHRLVAQAFLGPSDLSVNHKNCDKTDNRLSNLEYCTLQRNAEHAVENDMHRYGTRVGNAKLTEDAVREIRQLKEAGMHYKEIAAKFGIHPMNVYQICGRHTWRHVS